MKDVKFGALVVMVLVVACAPAPTPAPTAAPPTAVQTATRPSAATAAPAVATVTIPRSMGESELAPPVLTVATVTMQRAMSKSEVALRSSLEQLAVLSLMIDTLWDAYITKNRDLEQTLLLYRLLLVSPSSMLERSLAPRIGMEWNGNQWVVADKQKYDRFIGFNAIYRINESRKSETEALMTLAGGMQESRRQQSVNWLSARIVNSFDGFSGEIESILRKREGNPMDITKEELAGLLGFQHKCILTLSRDMGLERIPASMETGKGSVSVKVKIERTETSLLQDFYFVIEGDGVFEKTFEAKSFVIFKQGDSRVFAWRIVDEKRYSTVQLLRRK